MYILKKSGNLFKIAIWKTLIVTKTVYKRIGHFLQSRDCLTFKKHISKLCDKLKKYTGVFYLLRHNLPKHCLRTLYFTFIFNNLYYCAEVYGNTTASYLNPLQIAQNKALRALQFKSRYYPINEMHKEFQILKVHDIIGAIQKVCHRPRGGGESSKIVTKSDKGGGGSKIGIFTVTYFLNGP